MDGEAVRRSDEAHQRQRQLAGFVSDHVRPTLRRWIDDDDDARLDGTFSRGRVTLWTIVLIAEEIRHGN